jgi:hypothetical protein
MQNENEIKQLKTHSINFVKRDFESELQALHICMMVEILVVFALFLTFASSKVHNMFKLMLDL